MVNIKRTGKYCYVEDDDCYILYYFFKYRFKENKCYFNKKYLNKVIYVLVKNRISLKYNEHLSYDDSSLKYEFYINLGKDRLMLNNYLSELKSKLFDKIESRKFNQIYNKLIRLG